MILALIFDYINGFHDAANSIATVVSTKVLTPFQAVAWAAFFNFVAFFIFTDHAVANTIAKTVKSEFITLPVIFSGLIAAIAWNLITWWYGIPSSSSHTLIGGFAGAAIAHAFDTKGFIGLALIVEDKKILQIILFIFLAPLIGMIVSMFITIVTINPRFWLRTGIMAVATAAMWFLFLHFQGVKVKENLSKFFEVEKLHTAAKKDATKEAAYHRAKANYDRSVELSKHYEKDGAQVVANRIISENLLGDIGAFKVRDVIATTFKIEGLRKAAQKNPEQKVHLEAITANLEKTRPLNAMYGKVSNEILTDTIARTLDLTALERENLLSEINGISVSGDLHKSLKRADNFGIRIGLVVIFVIFFLGFFYVDKMRKPSAARKQNMFKKLQLLSSAIFSIGHGGNDAQKVMGIIAAAMVAEGMLPDVKAMPDWIPLACYSAIALGTMSGGWKIIKTMGTKITKVTPLEGVAAETSGALTLFATEQMGIPVSTTHTITGAIMGVGATKRLSAVRWGVTINLVWAWILTIPVSAILAALVYYLGKLLF
ncbi:MAG: inorganic phosphate transporter [Chitinophagaceae bacterium]|nr:MAG: inorganic phosphate transporter [Chitinophagaceae bacterium]